MAVNYRNPIFNTARYSNTFYVLGNIFITLDFIFKCVLGCRKHTKGRKPGPENQQSRALSSPLSNYEKMFVLQMYVLRKQELNRLY
ncbi:hypothetical protein FHG68_15030 [Leptospira weilii]|nr:hypothetical protein FHG67_07220 [Leptospira weilii]QDK27834.1 hypothetical protein FHG68_15030 [Leptospira weilii]